MTSSYKPPSNRGQEERRPGQGPLQQLPQTPAPQAFQPQHPPTMPPQTPATQTGPGGGPVILHRAEHYYVRTSYRPGRRPVTNPLRKPSGNTDVMPRVMPQQKERIVDSETRLMPIVT